MNSPILRQLKEIEVKERDRTQSLVGCEQALLMIEREIDKGQKPDATVIGLLTVLQKLVEVLK